MHYRFASRAVAAGILAAGVLLWGLPAASADYKTGLVKPTNTCRALNTVDKDGEYYRQAFGAITPLEKVGTQVRRSSCATLLDKVQNPGAGILSDLSAYQVVLNQFFANYCHRDVGSGWKYDIRVRDTGPYVQLLVDGKWQGSEYGTHNAVVIWYSPGFYDFVDKRSQGKDIAMPQGAFAVKEMYEPPSSDCAGEDPINFKPSDSGVAFMVRHDQESIDGWYWGYYGWSSFPEQVDNLRDRKAVQGYFDLVDANLAANQSWQPLDGIPGAASINFGAGTGWGPGCLDCHASAKSYNTFADLKNITGGTPEDPINTYLSMNFPTAADPAVPKHVWDAQQRMEPAAAVVTPQYNKAFREQFGGIYKGRTPPGAGQISHMPSASFDTVWVKANTGGKAGVDSQYITSDQCFGCHDTGQTGLLFDMAAVEDKTFVDHAPYGTWRTSPMGLAGRDPIFFAQLASETQTFHKSSSAEVEDICLGCHGIQGQRQYTLDHALSNDGDCDQFSRAMVNEIPVADGQIPPGEHANYGALARDGISCTSCHHAIFKQEDIAGHFENGKPDAQNACVVERQQRLNAGVGHATLAATFTGSFLVGDPNKIAAQIPDPKPKPMQQALGLTPHEDATFSESDICGTCHTVHLPILHDGAAVGTVFEQTTYPEWAFSEFRTGKTANYPLGAGLASGKPSAGKLAVSCQWCHMESSDSGPWAGFPEGLVFPDTSPENQYVSKIATIQEKTNFPAADNTLPASDIDLERREGFARHTLVGLNVFFMSMARQFSQVLGIPKDEVPYVSAETFSATKAMPYIERTLKHMQESAQHKTATIAVESIAIDGETLKAEVKIENGVGHKFPSGVGFRRAFVEFTVLDAADKVLWGSGVTNGAGVILDNGAAPDDGKPIAGELWWDNQCKPLDDRLAFQPHFDTGARAITRQSQAQIYQELVMAAPPDYTIRKEVPGQDPVKSQPVDMCGTQLAVTDDKSVFYPGWSLTTSFLSICAQAKDNRLLPIGYLPFEDREAIAMMFTTNPDEPHGPNADSMAKKLAYEGGSWGVGNDPDYRSEDGKPYGGGDMFAYAIPLKDITGKPVKVTARLYYQATPPFYLQDRFCTAEGDDRDRLYYLAENVDLKDIAENWKLKIASAEATLSR